MNGLKIAMLQILPEGTLEGNLEKGIRCCKKAKALGADIAVFPEMWSTGYRIPEDSTGLQADAVPADGPFVSAFGEAARELGMAVCITFLERYDPSPRNSLCIFDRFGRRCLDYAKVHTCDFGEERRLTPGDGFFTVCLDTERGPVKVGAMICYDREFPESARVLMLEGAEIVLVPNACPMEINRISQLRARAFENMMGMVTVNYPQGQPDCNGHSTVFDGIAYRPEETGSRDTLLMEAGECEGIYVTEFPLKELREYRQHEVHGNAYRRPEKYGLLISKKVDEPFIRDDRRK